MVVAAKEEQGEETDDEMSDSSDLTTLQYLFLGSLGLL